MRAHTIRKAIQYFAALFIIITIIGFFSHDAMVFADETTVNTGTTSFDTSTLPTLSPEDAKTFFRFIYNQSDSVLSEVEIESNRYYHLVTGHYDLFDDPNDIPLEIEGFSEFVRSSMNAQVQESELKCQYLNKSFLYTITCKGKQS